VTYLSTALPSSVVDPARIGVLGICASGGYVSFAAQTDLRIQAVATVSSADTGRLTREGLLGTRMLMTPDGLAAQLQQAGQDRNDQAKGLDTGAQQVLPDPDNVPSGTPDLFREAADYYRTSRGGHPRSDGLLQRRNADLLANFDAFRFQAMISPRPLLMIVGGDADSAYYSRDALEAAKEPKELFVVPGKTHIALYDDTSVTMPKLVDFFGQAIGV
jgi:uncharacterized protein